MPVNVEFPFMKVSTPRNGSSSLPATGSVTLDYGACPALVSTWKANGYRMSHISFRSRKSAHPKRSILFTRHVLSFTKHALFLYPARGSSLPQRRIKCGYPHHSLHICTLNISKPNTKTKHRRQYEVCLQVFLLLFGGCSGHHSMYQSI